MPPEEDDKPALTAVLGLGEPVEGAEDDASEELEMGRMMLDAIKDDDPQMAYEAVKAILG